MSRRPRLPTVTVPVAARPTGRRHGTGLLRVVSPGVLALVVLALSIVAMAVLVVAPGAHGRSVARPGERQAEYTAVAADQGPLAVLPTRTSIDERDATGPAAPWRIVAVGAAVALLAGTVSRFGRRRVTTARPSQHAVRHWARFRAPPGHVVPAIRG